MIYVERGLSDGTIVEKVDYKRLSPFSHESKRIVGEIYEDLAKFASFYGILFHDDAYLSDYEDAGSAALDYYAKNWGLPASLREIRADPELFEKWTRKKTDFLIKWTHDLMERVRFYRPDAKSARNLYAEVVLNPESEAWFSQSLEKFLAGYDYTALMAMPYMEKARDDEEWLERLVGKVAQLPSGLDKTVFELQSVDWEQEKPVPSKTLARWMALLQRSGVHHFGYYPDDFIQSLPHIDLIKGEISISDYPYKEK